MALDRGIYRSPWGFSGPLSYLISIYYTYFKHTSSHLVLPFALHLSRVRGRDYRHVILKPSVYIIPPLPRSISHFLFTPYFQSVVTKTMENIKNGVFRPPLGLGLKFYALQPMSGLGLASRRLKRC